MVPIHKAKYMGKDTTHVLYFGEFLIIQGGILEIKYLFLVYSICNICL